MSLGFFAFSLKILYFRHRASEHKQGFLQTHEDTVSALVPSSQQYSATSLSQIDKIPNFAIYLVCSYPREIVHHCRTLCVMSHEWDGLETEEY